MAVKPSIVIASVLLLVIFVQQGSAIKCYECNSHYNAGCESNVPPSNFSVDCSQKNERDDKNRPIAFTFCRKILQVIEFSVNQLLPYYNAVMTYHNRYYRYDARNYAGSCYKRHGFGGRQIVCACENGDNCNHSNSLKSPMALIAMFSIGFIAFMSH